MHDIYEVAKKTSPGIAPPAHVTLRPPKARVSVAQVVALAGLLIILLISLAALIAVYLMPWSSAPSRRTGAASPPTNAPAIGMDVLPMH